MTDKQLQHKVVAVLEWEPRIDNTQIGVTVNQGVVALWGEVKTFAEKVAAEHVILRIYGVKAVANDLQVRFTGSLDRSDSAIAIAAVNALNRNPMLPANAITPAVSNGWITLTGELDWNYQRLAAVGTVHHLEGVRGVTDDIRIRPPVSMADEELTLVG